MTSYYLILVFILVLTVYCESHYKRGKTKALIHQQEEENETTEDDKDKTEDDEM